MLLSHGTINSVVVDRIRVAVKYKCINGYEREKSTLHGRFFATRKNRYNYT